MPTIGQPSCIVGAITIAWDLPACYAGSAGWDGSPSGAPREAILFIAQQLRLTADSLSRYPDDPRTW